ncbi:hypothetical protein ISCGN_025434 [Ixodes scapularis]
MSWHQRAFFASLALWIVAVLFVTPEGDQGTRPADGARQPFVPWPNILVTLLCAAIMSLGHSKLRLYLDEMTDALTAGRTSLNPYTVYGVNARYPEDTSAVARSMMGCHDRTYEFLVRYSENLRETEESIRSHVRMFIDDVSGWGNEIGLVTRELRTALSTGSPPPSSARRTQSADTLPSPTPASSDANPPGPRPPVGVKDLEDRLRLLVAKDRGHHKPPGHYNPEQGIDTPFRPQSYGMDREMEDTDFYNATRDPNSSSTRGSVTFPSPWYPDRPPRFAMSEDRVTDPRLILLERLGRHLTPKGPSGQPTPDGPLGHPTPEGPLGYSTGSLGHLTPDGPVAQPPPDGPLGQLTWEAQKPDEAREQRREAIEFKGESTEQETKILGDSISLGQLVGFTEDGSNSAASRNSNLGSTTQADGAETRQAKREQEYDTWGPSPSSEGVGKRTPDQPSKDAESN